MKTSLFLLALMLIGGPTIAQTDNPVTMRTSEWSPYIDQSLPNQGLAMELVTHIFARAGYRIDNTIEPFFNALEDVTLGKADMLGAAWRDDARDERFIYSKPYLMNELVVIQRSDTSDRHYSLGAMSDSRIGLIQDYAYGVDFSELPGAELVYETNIAQNLKNLLDNKVDFVVGDRRVIAMAVAQSLSEYRDSFAVAAISLPPRALYVAGSRAVPRPAGLVNEFNAALAEVKRDGSYHQIIEKWQARFPL
ncbi:MAG: transporter substrate-binding domain-containing protein [Pseudomonadota bacterium]